jgi:adhesin transport system membrane fusion protein
VSRPQDQPQSGQTGQTGKTDPGAATHMLLALCVLVVVAFGFWGYYGRLDVVSIAVGEVVPSSKVKSVQHLEGGIVHAILVREGDVVKPGQPLVVLERTISGANVQELVVRMTALRIDIARHQAELAGTRRIAFQADLTRDHKKLAAAAVKRFNARNNRIRNQRAVQRQLVTQRREEAREIRARIRKNREKLALLREQIKISDELMKEELTNRMIHLNLLKEETTLKGGIAEDGAAVKRTEAAVKEAQAEIARQKNIDEEEVRGQLDDKLRSFDEFAERLEKLEDNLARTVLRSPVEGVVKSLNVATVGGVVRPGDTVLDIVPIGDSLVIEAKLPAQDVGYISLGQTAMVMLASADAVRFGRIKGKVINVSPDTLLTADNLPYYKVRVEVEQDYFEHRDARYSLVPGVQVICSIQTGRRSVFDYLLDPFIGAFQAAMQER